MPKNKSESEVAQSFLTLCDPMDCSLPGSEEPLSPWNFPGKRTVLSHCQKTEEWVGLVGIPIIPNCWNDPPTH